MSFEEKLVAIMLICLGASIYVSNSKDLDPRILIIFIALIGLLIVF